MHLQRDGTWARGRLSLLPHRPFSWSSRMGLLESISLRARLLANSPRRLAAQAILTYLVIAPSATLLSTLVGSLSEYRSVSRQLVRFLLAHALVPDHRFPHPLLTTTLHLIISLLTLLALALFSRLALRLLAANRRLLSTPRQTSPSPRSLLVSLASHLPTTSTALTSSLTSFSLSSTLLAILASLIELRASRITEAPFWTLTRLLPLLLLVLLPIPEIQEGPRGTALLVWVVLMSGPAAGWGASKEGMLCGGAYAVCLAGWVLAAKAGMREGEKEDEGAGYAYWYNKQDYRTD
jgi:hypothetical protein